MLGEVGGWSWPVNSGPLGRSSYWYLLVALTLFSPHHLTAQLQAPTPIGDAKDLLPAGISRLPVNVNGTLAYTFKDTDGAAVLHCVGSCVVTLGDVGAQSLRAHEIVLWIEQRKAADQTYRQLHLLLRREVEIQEIGGTRTSGPAFFITLSTFGPVRADVDEFAYQSSAETQTFREGATIRRTLKESSTGSFDAQAVLRVIDVSGVADVKKPQETKPAIQVQSSGDIVFTRTTEGNQVLLITGGVYLSRGTPGKDDYVSIQADSAAVFLPLDADASFLGNSTKADVGEHRPRGLGPEQVAGEGAEGAARDGQVLSAGFGNVAVEAAYLEGDVVLRQGASMVRASRLYYEFPQDRALMLDVVLRTTVARRGIPLFVRAAEIRQLARHLVVASDAQLTTSEFHTPHYHVGAERVEIFRRPVSDLAEKPGGIRSGTFSLRHSTLNLGGHPLLYWPYVRGNIDAGETSIRSLRTGFSDDFGVELETDWHLFNVLGFETPSGFSSTLDLDYFTQRGPAIGGQVEYERDTYFGEMRSYFLSDNDKDSLGRDRIAPSKKDTRGRFLVRHRQFLSDDWQVSLELSYISDESFLEEFFETEFDNDKEQETLLYLKKQRDNWAITSLLQGRILDFTTQTERVPDLALFLYGEPIGSGATWYTENRMGIVRYRASEKDFLAFLRKDRLRSSGSVGRIDSRQELGIPLDWGPVRFVPFASIRGTLWDDSPADGGLSRVFGTYGVRGSMYLSRVYPEKKWALFDIDGVRHMIKPDITAWLSHTNVPSSRLFPFDETTESIDEVDGVTMGVRQRWQTKRGHGATRRTVDFFTFDVEAAFFNDARSNAGTNGFASTTRPENSIARNYVNSSLIWRINDRTALLSEVNYDTNDGEVDVLNFSLSVERSPRMNYLLAYRLIEETKSELFGFDLNYQLTEKHTLAVRELFDLDRGRALDFTVALIRQFPHWFGAVSFAFDDAEDDFGVSLSIWPEGLPQAPLESKRFGGFSAGSRRFDN